MYLWKDHTFSKKFKEGKSLYFKLVDISTVKKGPVYTFAKPDPNIKIRDDLTMIIGLEITYGSVDVPYDSSTSLFTSVDIKDESSRYSVYPLIKQMLGCNNYLCANNGELPYSPHDSVFMIYNVTINVGDVKLSLNEMSSEKQFNRMFREINMLTCMEYSSGFEKAYYVIIDKKRQVWHSDDISVFHEWNLYCMYDDNDIVLVCLPEIETCYKTTIRVIKLMERVSLFEIYVKYNFKENDEYETYGHIFMAHTIPEMFEAFLYIPQIISVERLLYNVDVTVDINLVIEDEEIDVIINEDETPDDANLCLYDIIERLLLVMEEAVTSEDI